MQAIAVIPARYGSTRFPGKMLADRTGKPLVQHVYERAKLAGSVERVLIATDDERIERASAAFGAEVIMTRPDHPNGTSRIAEVADRLDLAPDRLIVNVQGDEPELDPKLIDAAVELLADASTDDAQVSTIASPFQADEDVENPNIVKVVTSAHGRALYFSRSVIPHDRDRTGVIPRLKHVGLYVYRRSFLSRYVTLVSTPLEQAEHLEQLRILEHGDSVAVAVLPAHHHGIDTPEQYDAFVDRWRSRHDAAK